MNNLLNSKKLSIVLVFIFSICFILFLIKILPIVFTISILLSALIHLILKNLKGSEIEGEMYLSLFSYKFKFNQKLLKSLKITTIPYKTFSYIIIKPINFALRKIGQ
jgi:hypothetical protein